LVGILKPNPGDRRKTGDILLGRAKASILKVGPKWPTIGKQKVAEMCVPVDRDRLEVSCLDVSA
jgi:hypothetical protein